MKPVATKYVSPNYIIYHIYEWYNDEANGDDFSYPDKWFIYNRQTHKLELDKNDEITEVTLKQALAFVECMEN